MQNRAKQLIDTDFFHKVIFGLIIISAILVGIETNYALIREYRSLFKVLDNAVLALFTIEIVIRFAACGFNPRRFFTNGWNLFDFAIVAVCFIPMDAQYFVVLRLARILRIYRLINKVPRLNVLVNALLDSLPSIGYLMVLLFMHFYVYATTGVFLFGSNDPQHFGDLGSAFLVLFEIITLEGWIEIFDIQRFGCAEFAGSDALNCPDARPQPVAATLYFISFILIGAMIILNLFIAVITNSLQEMHDQTEMEMRTRKVAGTALEKDIETLKTTINQLQNTIISLESKIKKNT